MGEVEEALKRAAGGPGLVSQLAPPAGKQGYLFKRFAAGQAKTERDQAS